MSRTRTVLACVVAFACGVAATLALTELGRDQFETVAKPTDDGAETTTVEVDRTIDDAEETAVAGVTTTRLSDLDPNTFYVSPSGDDGRDGQAPETATRNLQTALDRLQPGQTLYLMDGVHYEPLRSGGGHFRLARSGTESAPMRIAAAPGARPVIRATNGTAIELVGSYLSIDGITLVGEGFSPENDFGFGVMAEYGHHISITNMDISGFPINGIGTIATSHMTIADNVVYNNAKYGPEQGSGISIYQPMDYGIGPDPDGYTDRIINNVVFGNENVVEANWRSDGMVTDGNGIIIDYSIYHGFSGRFLVANNVAVNNGGRGIHVFNSERVDIVHNTTFNNGVSRDRLFPAGSGAEIGVYSSSEVRVLDNALLARDGGTGLTVATWNNTNVTGAGNLYVGAAPSIGIGPDDHHEVATTPFTAPSLDARQGDFSLSPTSAGREGAVSGLIPFDLFGVARSVNADAGAIEATTTTSTPPSTVPTTTSPEAPTTSGTSGPQTSPTTVATPTTAGSGPSSTTAPRSADQRDDEQEESAAAPSTSTTGRADASPTLGGLESSGQSARIDSSSIDPLGAPADAPPAGTSEAASAAEVADESGTETTDAGAVEQAAEAPGSLALVSPPDDRAPGKSRRIGLAVGGLALMAVVASAVRSIAAHR